MARVNAGWDWLKATAAAMAMAACAAVGFAQPADSGAAAPAGDAKVEKNAAGEPVNADTQRVYLVNFQGEFARDVSGTPFKQLWADVKKVQPDILVFKIDFQFRVYGQQHDAVENDPNALYQLDQALELVTFLRNDLANDPAWVKKPRIVMWVKRALGGSAFLPFSVPDVYFTSDGIVGGIGGLERMAATMQDQRVKEKMWGIRRAQCMSLAQMGGHDDRLMRAMIEYRFKLSVDFEGGEPVYREDYSGEVILKEDITEDETRKDTLEQIARFQGNDTLTMRADIALKLKFAKGRADTLEEIMYHLGYERNYTVTEGRGKRILENWSNDLRKAERDIIQLWNDFTDIQVQGATPAERNQRRGAQIGVLKKIQVLLGRFKEAIDPRAIQGAPENWETRLDVMIEQIRQQMRNDK